MAGRPLQAIRLGRVDYASAWALQQHLADARWIDAVPDMLLLLEHPPTITLGRRGSLADVYLDDQALAVHGVSVHRSTRGGLVTYHGPGQVVGYPIVRLRAAGLTVPEYVHGLEQVVIGALDAIGIEAWTDPQNVGIWTREGKIAAVGVGVQHGVSLHGFAVNLQPDLTHFGYINPCGVGDLGVTSAVALLGHEVDVTRFESLLAERFAEHFGYLLGWGDESEVSRTILAPNSH